MTICEKLGTEVELKGVDAGVGVLDILLAEVGLAGKVEVSNVSVGWPKALQAESESTNIKKNIIIFIFRNLPLNRNRKFALQNLKTNH